MVTTARLYRNAAGLAEIVEVLQPGDAILAGEVPMAALTEADRLRLLAYPASLARRARSRTEPDGLRIVYVVPDWATDEALAAAGRPYNLTPAGRTYRAQPDPESCDDSRAHHWEALFEAHVQELKDAAGNADIEVARASEFIGDEGFQAVLRCALRFPRQIAEAIQEAVPGVEIDDEPLVFAGAECRACASVRGTTAYDPDWDRAQFECDECGSRQEADIREQNYWVQEDVLRAAVVAALKPSVSMRRPGPYWDAREALTDSLLLLALGDAPQLPARLAPPILDSERGGVPLMDLVGMADEWEEDHAELP